MADYHIEVLDAIGTNKLAIIKDFLTLEYVGTENKIGAATLKVPTDYRSLFFTGDDVKVDTRLLFYRSLPGSTPYLDMDKEWFIYKGREVQDSSGRTSLVLHAVDALWILDTRTIAYDAYTAYTEKTALFAGNLIKALVRENCGALATVAARDLSTWMTVQADLNDGYSPTSKSCARRKLLTTCQEVADFSAQLGTYLAFDVTSVSPGVLEFRTYQDYRGTDRRASSGQPLLVGRSFGNISDFDLAYDHSGEVTYCDAGGLGEGDARTLGSGSDTTRIAASPFRRIEYFRDGLNTADVTTLNNEASAVVRANRPKRTLQATIAQTDSFLYGMHFKLGDFITISDRYYTFDARIPTIKVFVSKGKETITAKVRGDY